MYHVYMRVIPVRSSQQQPHKFDGLFVLKQEWKKKQMKEKSDRREEREEEIERRVSKQSTKTEQKKK